ncbi:MAG: RloB domain-containing protein [Oscillatoria sp. SIO1A7]|nr:RloB domain-containing protein [Oscillatoria sp. SIO1A7]
MARKKDSQPAKGKKGKGKSTRDLRRRTDNRQPREYILIVVEGKETEYKYFQALNRDLKLTSALVEVVPGSGGDPLAVVNKAQKLREKKKPDRVFCVFDRNGLPHYQEAFQAAKNYGFEEPIASTPCFEFWFLLHYRYTEKAFGRCQEVIPELEKELIAANVLKAGQKYNKNLDLYRELKPKLQDAIANAQKLEERQAGEAKPNPSTKVHVLVKFLQEQKNIIP